MLNRCSIMWVLLVVVALAGSLGAAVALESADADDQPFSHPITPVSDERVAAAHAAISQEPMYEGGRAACRRCHLSEFRSWGRTPHANAFETLPEENRGDPECVRCHVTGYGQPSGFTSIEETPDLANVTCEVCHGPGSLYKDEDTMKDRDAAIAAGLVIPTEQTCTRCHNADSPTFPGSFDFEAMKAEGVHEISR